MNYLLAGASTFGVKNAGDDAMFLNLVDSIRRRDPGCELTFLARHPDESFDKAFGVRSIKNIDHDTRAQSIGRWFWGFNPGDPTDHLESITDALTAADVLIVGGNAFMEISPNTFMRGVASYASVLATWARLLRTPFALYGVAGHPISDQATKEVARFVCHNATAVTVRESWTREILGEAGIELSNVHVLADPAFGIDPVVDRREGIALLNAEGMDPPRKGLAGVAFRHQYWAWSDEDFAGYLRAIAELSDAVVEELDLDVLFIPNCTYGASPYQDDRTVAPLIRSQMRHPERAHLILGEHSLRETLSMYRLLDLLISNRRHSCIFAALNEVPLLALRPGPSWRWHYDAFMQTLGLGGHVVGMEEDDYVLRQGLLSLWADRDAVVESIRARLPGLRALARRHVDVICDATFGRAGVA